MRLEAQQLDSDCNTSDRFRVTGEGRGLGIADQSNLSIIRVQVAGPSPDVPSVQPNAAVWGREGQDVVFQIRLGPFVPSGIYRTMFAGRQFQPFQDPISLDFRHTGR
jgi:hypothetical protein